MAKKFGWSESKTYYLLADLKELRLLENTPHYSAPKHHRTRVRQMNIAAFLVHPGLQDRPSQDSKIGQDSKIQDSKIDMQDSKIRVQDSNVTLESKDTVTDTVTVTTTKAQAKPSPLENRRTAVIEEFSEEVYRTLLDFEEHRKKLRAPMTERAFELILKKLARFRTEGMDPVEVLEQSIMNGWVGIFPVRKEGTSESKSFQERRSEKTAQAISKVLGRFAEAPGSVQRALPPTHK